MVKVHYNGENPFQNIAPTPFISVGEELIRYGNRFGSIETLTLNGNITGKCNDFNDLISKQNSLLQKFSTDFKTLEIFEDGIPTPIYSRPYVKVENISFESANYVGILPFSINLNIYPSEFFTGVYGILDPVNQTSYTEQKDGTVNITRSFSARGFNTDTNNNNALNNAITYVRNITGQAPITPKFITSPGSTLRPRQISETIDRMNSTYSVDIEYVYRKGATSNSIFSYTIDINYNEEVGIYSVSINGNLSAGIGTSIESLRTEFAGLRNNIFNLAFSRFKEITNKTYLNSIPLNFNITEDPLENVINFTYSYDSDPYTVKFDKNFSLNYDYPTDLYTLGFNGTLTTRGSQNGKMAILESELSKINVKSLAQAFYASKVGSTSSVLNTNYKSYEIRRDINNPQITISAQFDNSPIPPRNFKTFNYSISITPSIYVFNPVQFLNGDNGAFKMNYYKRGSLSVNGRASFNNNSDNSALVRSEAEKILNTYAIKIGASRRLRTEDKIERSLYSNEDGYTYTFSLTETCETSIFSI